MTSCGETHFITDDDYRARVHEDFLKRKEVAAGRSHELFGVFEGKKTITIPPTDHSDTATNIEVSKITTEQREALEFLYAYMPLCDLSEYDGEFFLRQVDGAFRARDYFSWGKSVPEDIFRHFVLPVRATNEYLDDSRDVFFEELKGRVKGLSMYEAALEVNHWCHEKVTYRATDPRTLSPLALVRTSWGRCGEEAAFGVAAMRAVGIPARQGSTPRWVHTDSNHAWVEVWIDGKWYYLGACEPEPELNVAWFDGPVQRAMMVNATVYGPYVNEAEESAPTEYYSVVNLLGNYAKVREAVVKVVDADGNPAQGVAVNYKVYNYGDLFTIASRKSDADGRVSFNTGMGDVLAWASHDGMYGYVKSSPADGETVLKLDRKQGTVYSETFTMLAPSEQPFRELAPEKIAANAASLAKEDSIRNAYMATFPDEDYAARVAAETGLPKEKVWKALHTAQGNWREIESFIRNNSADSKLLFGFLDAMRGKDLQDTPAAYLEDHYRNGIRKEGVPDDIYAAKVLSPRIGNELIKPWRGHFLQSEEFWRSVSSGMRVPIQRTGGDIAAYVKKRITVADMQNFINTKQTPRGVHEIRMADRTSRDIYFVALCRTMGIPAHIEQATGKTQYYEDGVWHDVLFESTNAVSVVSPKGRLTLNSDSDNIIKPAYKSHFTIARYQGGDFRVLDLSDYPEMKGLPAVLDLDEGYYRLLVSSRGNDGSATISTQYFNVEKGKPITLTVGFPKVEGKLFVKGIVDMNSEIFLNDGSKTTLKKLGNGRGVMLCFADPDREPTKHILQDMPSLAADLEEWGGGLLFMVPGDKVSAAFNPSQFPGQPSQMQWAVDEGRILLNATSDALQMQFSNNFPLVVYLNNNGGILFSSQGYRLGIVGDVLKTIRQEEATKINGK